MSPSSRIKVGIEAISFDLPQHFLNLTDLALARGIEPTKFTSGLGQTQMSVPTPCEDSVSLASGAGLRLLESFQVDPNSIGLLIVGTETGIDHSKPVSSYVHELLGLNENCRVYETKHACYGAMAGVGNAMNWILSGRARGKKALVIASDIAYYGLKTPGEPTQGAGAVAMLISDQPDLVELDPEHDGYYSKQVMDFWRPLYSKEAFADGHYSIQCYLNALRATYQTYKKSVAQTEKASLREFSKRFSALFYHAPFSKMSLKAHIHLLETDAEKTFEKESGEMELARKDFQNRIAPWTEINSRVGNIYTGSVFLSLISFLQSKTTPTPGEAIALFSYGSGCSAEFLGGSVGSGIGKISQLTPYSQLLEERKPLSVEKYETLMKAYAQADLNGAEVCDPSLWNLTQRVIYRGTQNHQRKYDQNSKPHPTT